VNNLIFHVCVTPLEAIASLPAVRLPGPLNQTRPPSSLFPAKKKGNSGNIRMNSGVYYSGKTKRRWFLGWENVQERHKLALFERTVTPHVGAAYNLARWLTRNDQDAEDVVQEACLRAFRSIEGFHGGDSRAWILAIVRNACYTWLHRNRNHDLTIPFDDRLQDLADDSPSPEALILKRVEREALTKAVEELPMEFREIVVLREMEDLSYKEIAQIADLPIGTVMSRLARARRRLQQSLPTTIGKELQREL
jgi:RNA polymerase sigma-70 factor (ECF subfamily)